MSLTLPFPNSSNWSMDIQLGTDIYNLRGLWNDRLQAWTLTIATQAGDVIISGMRMVLNWPLFYGTPDSRLPNGHLFVVDPSRKIKTEPGRFDFRDNRMKLVFVEFE